MLTLDEVARSIADLAGTSWSLHTGPQFAALTSTGTGSGFAPNIVVTESDVSAPTLDAPSTAVVLGQIEADAGVVAAHQVLVDGSMGETVAHEIVWLRGAEGMVRVVASAVAPDVGEVATLMQDWLRDLNTPGERT